MKHVKVLKPMKTFDQRPFMPFMPFIPSCPSRPQKHLPAAAVVFVCALAQALSAQEAVPAQTPSGAIAGVLTSADLGHPVRKAQIRLVSASPRMTRTTTTDADGRYAFPNLPAGEYTLSASKPGYLDIVFGARRPGASSIATSIRLTAGQRLENVSLRLPRGGVIAGVITDEFGDPAFNTPVRSMRYGFSNGERMLQPAGNAVTDDRGAYRIAGLLPGEYLVSAVPRDIVATTALAAEAVRDRMAQVVAAERAAGNRVTQSSMEEARREGRVAEPVSPTGYVPVYYPGTPQPSTAARVRVGVSEEVSGVDIRLQVVQTATVSGTVASGEHALPAGVNVQLIDPALPIANVGVWFRTARPDGTFSFYGVVPGAYALRARASLPATGPAGGGELTAAMDVPVGVDGARDVALRLQRGVSVSGSLSLDSVNIPIDLPRVRVELFPISTSADWEMALMRVTPDAGGKFVLHGVAPGRYRVSVGGLPDGWRLASAVFGDKDAADYHLNVEADGNYAGGILRLTERTSEVAGALSNASGAPVTDRSVILFPADRGHWLPQSRRIHVTQPGPDGRYTIRSLPAGDYRVAAVVDPEPGQQFDPEFLAQLLTGSTAITLGEGEKRTQDIRVR